MKRVCILLAFFLLCLGVVNAAASVEAEFVVRGCNFIFEGENVGVSVGSCSSGDASGFFYCDDSLNGYRTTEDTYGCSMGLDEFTLGDDFCCPSGMFCNSTSFLCQPRFANCFDQTSEDDCKENGCIWLDLTDQCADGRRDFDCSYYDEESSCEADEWNLGQEGIGTDLCGSAPIECGGKTLYVPADGCECEWYGSSGGCQLKMIAEEKYYTGTPDKFSCTNTYSLGECIDGQQDVSWFSSDSVISGFSSGIPQECLDAFGCAGGEDKRFCGEPLIKLSFFSFFSLLACLGMIFLFYFSKKD
ncbi:hypothetical protein HNV12_00810 [Methanococcoides sp. SA1]|nr:hypothetical protein [Methanococcoides sp. SA1]